MTEWDRLTIADLLSGTADALPVPDPAVFATTVTRRLRAGQAVPGRPMARVARGYPRVASIAAALVAICATAAALAPPVRSAVADLFGVNGVHITRAQPLPIPTTAPPPSVTTQPVDPVTALNLGSPTTLQGAARLVHFTMRIPTMPGYQQPDAVLVATPPAGGMASLVYRPGPGRPSAEGTGIAGFISEFRGHLDGGFFQKLAGNGTTVQPVQVAGVAGFWLSGAPHEFFYVAPDGTVAAETIRLASNTLLWSAGGITYRFESGLSESAAIAIAASMR